MAAIGDRPPFMVVPTMMMNDTEMTDFSEKTLSPTLEKAKLLMEEDPRKATLHFKALLKQDNLSSSDRVDALMGLAKSLLMYPQGIEGNLTERSLEEALALLLKEHSIEHSPLKTAEVYKYLAIWYTRMKDNRAEECYEKGIKACKFHLILRWDCAAYLLKKGDSNGALEVCNGALLLKPDSADFLYTRAKIHRIRNEWELVVRDVDAFSRIPHTKKCYQREMQDLAAECCSMRGLLKDACKYMEAAYKNSNPINRVARSKQILDVKLSIPLTDIAYRYRAQIIKGMKAYPEIAFKLLDLLVDTPLNPSDRCEVLQQRARIQLKMEDKQRYALVRKDLEEALKILDDRTVEFNDSLDSKKACCFGGMAVLAIYEENYDQAMDLFSKSLASKVVEGPFHDFVNFLSDYKKDLKMVVQVCNQVLDKSPDHPQALYHLAQAYYTLGEWSEVCKVADLFYIIKDEKRARKLKIITLAAEAADRLGDLPSVYKYKKDAYLLDNRSSLLETFDQLSKLHKLSTMEETRRDVTLNPNLKHVTNSAEACLEAGEAVDALKLFDYLLDQKCETGDRVNALIGRAKACIAIGAQENCESAYGNLEEALKLLSKEKSVESLKSEVFSLLGQIDLIRNKIESALKNFERGWQLEKTFDILDEYSSALVKNKQLDKALRLCEEYENEGIGRAKFVQWKVYYLAKKWEKALEVLRSIIKSNRCNNQTKLSALKKAGYTALQMKDYKTDEELLRKTIELDASENAIHAVRDLMEAYKLAIVAEQLYGLCAIENPDLPYLVAVLTTYKNELPKHPKQYVDLLVRSAKMYEQVSGIEMGKALDHYESALAVLERNPGVFPEAQQREIESALKQIKKEFPKQIKVHVKGIQERAQKYELAGNFSEAIQEYSEIANLFKKYPEIYSQREQEKILAGLKKAKEDLPKQMEAQVALLQAQGLKYEQEGKMEKAQRDFSESLRIVKEYEEIFAQEVLAQIEACLNRIQVAKEEKKG